MELFLQFLKELCSKMLNAAKKICTEVTLHTQINTNRTEFCVLLMCIGGTDDLVPHQLILYQILNNEIAGCHLRVIEMYDMSEIKLTLITFY